MKAVTHIVLSVGTYLTLSVACALFVVVMRDGGVEDVPVYSVESRLVDATAAQLWPTLDTAMAYLYAKEIVKWSKLVPPQLVAAQMLLESRGNPEAVSRMGAVGLMQVMPMIWQGRFPQCGDSLAQWQTNICYGIHVQNYYLEQTNGDVTHALNLYWGVRRARPTRYTREIEERLKS